jgi:NAD(P)-dependent dehydrogenase (short-subunit alcohol dehydrogenase family)
MPSFGKVEGKVALVTGAASGIGKATADLLAREGASVVVADIETGTGQEVAQQIVASGGNGIFLSLDVGEESDWKKAIDHILHTFGRLDIAVNNAGIAAARQVPDMTLSEWRRVMQVNLDGVFLGTKYAIAAMRSGQGGSIINVASASGIKASAGASAYCASKAAVRMFSKTVALECAAAASRIRVNTVSPGGVKTPIWEKMDFWPDLLKRHGSKEEVWKQLGAGPAGEFFSPEEIAQAILFLVSDESSYLNGAELVVDRGFTS